MQGAGFVQAQQVVGVVRKVGVHLEHVLVAAGQRPPKAVDVGRAQPLLAAALLEVQPARELGLQAPHHGRRTVGRAVVDDQHVERPRQLHHLANNQLGILALVVSRNQNEAFTHAAKDRSRAPSPALPRTY